MNKEFVKRQAQVLQVLGALATGAAKRKETLIFIGGSAIQTAVLKKARRLSVDLDIYYSGNADELFDVLKPEYQVEKRKTLQTEIFDFYNIVKGDVQVKVDVAKFKLMGEGISYQTVTLGEKNVYVNVAAPSYLLASKFSTLALGTVGRRKFSPIDFLKDVFDSNALIDECEVSPDIVKYFSQICRIQNKINKTAFTEQQIIENIVKRLLESAHLRDDMATIKKNDLGNFNEYLLRDKVKKNDYWVMAHRLAAYTNAIAFKQRMPNAIKEIEKNVDERYSDKAFVDMCEQKLKDKGGDPAHLHELKILAPKALVYFYYLYYPPKK